MEIEKLTASCAGSLVTGKSVTPLDFTFTFTLSRLAFFARGPTVYMKSEVPKVCLKVCDWPACQGTVTGAGGRTTGAAAYSREGSLRCATAAGPLRKSTSTLLTRPSPNSA